MRKCIRCGTEMVEKAKTKKGEELDLHVLANYYNVRIKTNNDGFFAKYSAQLKVAICPNCSEVSFYVDTLDGLEP